MRKISVSGIELTATNPREILGMGGPYIGDVSIGDELISKDCVLDNFLLEEDKQLVFFVKYHCINSYQYFTINFYNITAKAVFEFDKEFDMVHIGEFITKDSLAIYRAFHDGFKNEQLIFNLDEENFSQLA